MRGSFQIARIWGIPVKVHWSFAFLFLFVIYVGKSQRADWASIGVFGLFVLALFVCVVLHELGHALSARQFGVTTKDITILPVAGFARLDKLPEKPFEEFVVAVMGPLVNFAIYIVLALYLSIAHDLNFSLNELIFNETDVFITEPRLQFVYILMRANLGLVFLNMVPAFPMDGGRVLRGLLAMRWGRQQATLVAATLGQIIALMVLVYAIFPIFIYFLPENNIIAISFQERQWQFQPVLALIAAYVLYAARLEYAQAYHEKLRARIVVEQVMRTEFSILKSGQIINDVRLLAEKTMEKHFLVADEADILRGVLFSSDFDDARNNAALDALVSTYAHPVVLTATVGDRVYPLYTAMRAQQQPLVPVYDNGLLVGVLVQEDLEAITV